MRVGSASSARFDATAVLIEGMTITDQSAVREAQRWTTGQRGPLIDGPSEHLRADLSAFVAEALGARSLAATGPAADACALERLLKEMATGPRPPRAGRPTWPSAPWDAADTVTRMAIDMR